MPEYIKIPIVNGLRIVLQEPASQVNNSFDFKLLEDEICLPFVKHPYRWPVQTDDETTIQIQSNYGTNTLEIRHSSDDTLEDSVSATLVKTRASYNVYEFVIDWSTIPVGYYYVKVIGSEDGFTSYSSKSEPIELKTTHEKSVLLTWYNFEEAHDVFYPSGVEFSIRIPGYIRRNKLGGSRDVSPDSENKIRVVEEDVYRTISMYTDNMPDYLHELITIIGSSDAIFIDSIQYAKEKAYEWDLSKGSSLSKGELLLRQYDFNYQNLHDSNERELVTPVPTNLAAVAASSTEINLTWDEVASADQYKVYRSTSVDGTYTLIATQGVVDYSDTGLDPATEYFYKVTALIDGDESEKTAAASATTLNYFIATYKTDNAGSSGSSTTDSVKLPLMAGGTYNFSMYNDDTDALIATVTDYSQYQVTFPSSGTFRVRFEGTISGWEHNSGYDPLKLLEIHSFGQLSFGASIAQFYGCANLVISATDSPDLSGTTSLRSCFRGLSSFNSAIGHWDVSTIQSFQDCFEGCSDFNQDLSDWDMSAATSLAGMFEDAESFNQDISGWDVSSVLTFEAMFKEATDFNQNISSWTTSASTSFKEMFREATSFNQNISIWTVSAGTDFSYMFYNATSFNQDISGWNMSNATTIEQMFNGATAFAYSLDDWDVSGVTNMIGVFANTTYNQDITSWETGAVTSMASMFFGNTAFNQDISGWDTGAVESMLSMFYNASAFNQNISGWDVSSCELFTTMFYHATAFNQDISGWTTTALTSTNGMFNGATSFDQDLGSWNVTGLTDAANMFYGVTLSTANCNALLVGWEAQSLQSTVTLNLGSSTYDYGDASLARDAIIADRSWTITDGGEAAWPGCVAYYKLDELSGNAIDSAGANNGTVNGATQGVAGKISTAYSFDSINDYLSMGNVLGFDSNNAFSFSVWFKKDGFVSTKFILSKDQYVSPSFTGYYLGVNLSKKLFLSLISDAQTGDRLDVEADFVVTANTLTHVVVTYDGSKLANGVKMFVDGVERVCIAVNDNLVGSITNPSPFQIASAYDGTIANFDGTIDEIACFNRALATEEITDLYNGGSGKTYP